MSTARSNDRHDGGRQNRSRGRGRAARNRRASKAAQQSLHHLEDDDSSGEMNANLPERFGSSTRLTRQSAESGRRSTARPMNSAIREYFKMAPPDEQAPKWLLLAEVPTIEELLGDDLVRVVNQSKSDVEDLTANTNPVTGWDWNTTESVDQSKEWAENTFHQTEDPWSTALPPDSQSSWNLDFTRGIQAPTEDSWNDTGEAAEMDPTDELTADNDAKDLKSPSMDRDQQGWGIATTEPAQMSWDSDPALPAVSNMNADNSSWNRSVSGNEDENTSPSAQDELEQRRIDAQEDPETAGFTDKTVNYVEGAWPSKDVYLRNHYKLLREDAFRPLRETVRAFIENPDMQEDRSNAAMGIYEQTRLCGITLSPRGIGFRMNFSTRRTGRKIRWEQSKRLISGSLVVLVSAKSPRTCRVATVAARPLSGLKNANPPEIDLFFNSAKDIDFDCATEWIMLENRSGFFEASRHTMVALQRMMQEDFRMSEYLVDVQKQVKPPQYLIDQPVRNVRSMCNDVGPAPQNFIDILRPWPTDLRTSLDPSQQDAVKRILTKGLSIVQGPPGTGKTFTSVASLKILTANFRAGDAPIVIACQTNHALDQLLRHVAEFETSYARIGGQSQDPQIREHTVYSLREKEINLPSNRPAPQWVKLTKEIAETLAPLSGSQNLLNTAQLLRYGILTPSQVESLSEESNAWSTAGDSVVTADPMKAWLGAQVMQAKSVVPYDFGFEEQDDSDDEFEEMLEQEAEQITRDEEDELERLKGEFIPVEEVWTGKVVKTVKATVMEKQLRKESDLSKIKVNERGQYYRYFMSKFKEAIAQELRALFDGYQTHVKSRMIRRFEIDESVLRDKRVIGLTTTGLAKYRALIASLHPKILIIEEAAETLEAPVAAGCVESLEHLILVGDHQQLRPHCHVTQMERSPINMNISMFERLIQNGVEFSRLGLQRRMRPSISRLLKPIYKNRVQDHPSVNDFADVPGMSVSCYFFTHEFPESKDQNLSTFNIQEAEMVAGFARYLVLNGTRPNKITIITFYQGQRKKLMLMLRRDPMLGADIQVKTVDSYQGEENDIMILSLVRNNDDSSVGFLSVENRICVAISRAKRGFYMFGNARLLCGESKLWGDIVNILCEPGQGRQLGYFLPTQCQRHGRMSWFQGKLKSLL
ncbi:MAG: hypothetical protein M1828_000327 [Chrysothrix sp. TS-e1954]|nr:MAG: hypothetical protein M1828_000327 [Chrysothrix sp. TS-e1954]